MYHVLLRHWTPRHPPRTLSTCSPVIRGGGYSIRRTSSRVLRCAFHLSTEQCPLYPEDICSQRVCALAASVVVNLPLASRQLQKAASQLPLPAPSTRFPPRLMALAERPAHRASLIFTCSTTTRLRLPTKQPGETPGRRMRFGFQLPRCYAVVFVKIRPCSSRTGALCFHCFRPSTLERAGPCGDEGTRTPDLRLAKAPLSQLSYIPTMVNSCGSDASRTHDLTLIRRAL